MWLHYRCWLFLLLSTGIIRGQKDLHLMCVGSWPEICDAASFAVDVINNMTNFLDGYTLHVENTLIKAQDIGQTFKTFIDNVDDKEPTKIGIIGPSFSSQAKVMAEMAKYYNLVQSSNTVSSPLLSDTEKYPYFTRTSISSALRNQAIMPILKRYNWTNIATLGKQDEFIKPTMDNFIEEDMRDEDMTLLSPAVYQSDPKPQIQQLKSADARVIVVYNWFRSADVSRVECQAYHEGMYGKRYQWIYWWCGLAYLLATSEYDNDGCTREQRLEAVEGALCIEDATNMRSLLLNYTGDTGLTLEELEKRYMDWQYADGRANVLNIINDFRKAFDSAYSIAKALNQTAQMYDLSEFTYDNKTMADQIYLEITKLNFIGASGHISYNSIGNRNGTVIVNQIRNGSFIQVASYDPDNGQMVWQDDVWFRGGLPPVDRPEEKISVIRRDILLFVVMTTVSILGAVFSAVCVIFNTMYREMKVIKLSSPRLNTLIAIGCMLSYYSVILIGMDYSMVDRSPVLCYLRVLALTSAFTCAFGSMFVKTWRVHTLFTNRQVTRKIVKDGHLFTIIGVVWAIDIAILVVWSVSDPITWKTLNMTRVTAENEQMIVTPQVVMCYSRYDDIWMASFYVIKGLMLMFGIFFAWETRKVRVEALNDSKQIGICVYNVMVLSAITVPLIHILSDSQLNIKFTVIACSILVCSTSTLAFVFGPKMHLIATKGNQVDDSPVLPFAASLHERSMSSPGEPSTQHRNNALAPDNSVSGRTSRA